MIDLIVPAFTIVGQLQTNALDNTLETVCASTAYSLLAPNTPPSPAPMLDILLSLLANGTSVVLRGMLIDVLVLCAIIAPGLLGLWYHAGPLQL